MLLIQWHLKFLEDPSRKKLNINQGATRVTFNSPNFTRLRWMCLVQATFSLLTMERAPKEGSPHLNGVFTSVLTRVRCNPDK